MGLKTHRIWLALPVLLVGISASFMAPAGLAAVPENDPPSFQGRQFPFTILKPNDPAPATPIYTLRGGVTTLKRFSGKVILLNLWATWCPACVHELPTLGKLQTQTGGETFSVVTLALDQDAVVSSYLKRLGVQNLPTYLDPAGRILKPLQMGNALPLSVLIDHRGRVMGYMKGAADWTSIEARALIDYYIGHISP
ncbi:MAG: TlpA family protein disulfide reductase [Rhodospirillales bacterium]|nr:TlpA family protein disulfide reductase [Rhodospirillales bacterium]